MRILAVVLTLLLAAPAAADYRRLPGPPPDDDLVVSDGTVIVGANSSLTYHRPDGTTRTRRIPGGSRFVEEVNASGTAATIIMIDETRGLYGPVGGPFKRFPGDFIDVAVSGSEAMALYRRQLRIVDVRTGRHRSLRFPDRESYVLTAAGRYFAYRTSRAIVVRSLRTGREIYRIRTAANVGYRLAPGGQLVDIGSGELEGYWRIRVATPQRPRWRTIREIGLGSHSFAVTRRGIVLARGDARARTEVALLGFDGRLRPVTPLLPRVGAIAYDGTTLAFSVGNCIFTGPAEFSPVATDGCVPSADGGAGG